MKRRIDRVTSAQKEVEIDCTLVEKRKWWAEKDDAITVGSKNSQSLFQPCSYFLLI